jgi:hypothetical protein
MNARAAFRLSKNAKRQLADMVALGTVTAAFIEQFSTFICMEFKTELLMDMMVWKTFSEARIEIAYEKRNMKKLANQDDTTGCVKGFLNPRGNLDCWVGAVLTAFTAVAMKLLGEIDCAVFRFILQALSDPQPRHPCAQMLLIILGRRLSHTPALEELGSDLAMSVPLVNSMSKSCCFNRSTEWICVEGCRSVTESTNKLSLTIDVPPRDPASAVTLTSMFERDGRHTADPRSQYKCKICNKTSTDMKRRDIYNGDPDCIVVYFNYLHASGQPNGKLVCTFPPSRLDSELTPALLSQINFATDGTYKLRSAVVHHPSRKHYTAIVHVNNTSACGTVNSTVVFDDHHIHEAVALTVPKPSLPNDGRRSIRKKKPNHTIAKNTKVRGELQKGNVRIALYVRE